MFRLSLRTLLIAQTATCIVLAFLGPFHPRAPGTGLFKPKAIVAEIGVAWTPSYVYVSVESLPVRTLYTGQPPEYATWHGKDESWGQMYEYVKLSDRWEFHVIKSQSRKWF